MGRIISSFFVAADGVVESPEKWHFPYFNDEMGAAVGRAASAKAFVFGRQTYDEWAPVWPDRDDDFANLINNLPKYVVSTTMTEADWSGTTVISDDPEGQVASLKESIDGDVMVAGGPTLVRLLLTAGLLDELNLLVHPIALGEGLRLFDGVRQPLELVRSNTFSTGVLDLSYVPASG